MIRSLEDAAGPRPALSARLVIVKSPQCGCFGRDAGASGKDPRRPVIVSAWLALGSPISGQGAVVTWPEPRLFTHGVDQEGAR